MVGTILKSNRKNTILSVQFQNVLEKYQTLGTIPKSNRKKYHTVGTIPKSNRKKYHTVCTIPKSNRKIPHCWYNPKI